MPKVQNNPCFLTPNRIQPQYPLFVFLPGMDGTGQLLRSQTVGLEAGFDVRCLMIPPDDLTSWDQLTQQVVDLIQAELKNQARQVYLCGESFGSCLAIKLVLHSPQLFDKLILINPASSFHRRSWYTWGAQLINFTPPCLFQVGALGLLPFLGSLERINERDRRELLETMRSVPPATVLWRMSLVREFEVSETQLREINQRTLLIASARDRLLPSLVEIRRLVKILPHAQMIVLPNSGHACLLESDINLYQIMQNEKFLDFTTDSATDETEILKNL